LTISAFRCGFKRVRYHFFRRSRGPLCAKRTILWAPDSWRTWEAKRGSNFLAVTPILRHAVTVLFLRGVSVFLTGFSRVSLVLRSEISSISNPSRRYADTPSRRFGRPQPSGTKRRKAAEGGTLTLSCPRIPHQLRTNYAPDCQRPPRCNHSTICPCNRLTPPVPKGVRSRHRQGEPWTRMDAQSRRMDAPDFCDNSLSANSLTSKTRSMDAIFMLYVPPRRTTDH